MNRINPLFQFHEGIAFDGFDFTVQWYMKHRDLLALLPSDSIGSIYSNQIFADLSMFGVSGKFMFRFTPSTGSVFDGITLGDRDPNTLYKGFEQFASAIKETLGEPSIELKKDVLWHDRLLVLRLSISNLRDSPQGVEFPCFVMSFLNTLRRDSHWNNRPSRPLGLEKRG